MLRLKDLAIAAVLMGGGIGCSSDAEIGTASDDGGRASDGSGGRRAEEAGDGSAHAGTGNAAHTAANVDRDAEDPGESSTERAGAGGEATTLESAGTAAGGTFTGRHTGGSASDSEAGGGPSATTQGAGGTHAQQEGTGGTGVSENVGGTGTTQSTVGDPSGAGTGGLGSEDTGGTDSGANSGGPGGSAGSSSSTSLANYAVGEDGLVTTCGWRGYAWIAVDEATSIEPANFDDLALGRNLCVSGTVAPAEDWSGYAMVGINIGQSGGGDENAPIPTDGSGIYVNIANHAGSPLRIEIQDSSGPLDVNYRWCAEYTRPGVIRWSDFNTECWEGGEGVAYAGQNLNSVIVLVPGEDADPIDFDFCINELSPAGSASCTGGSASNTGGSGSNTGGTSGDAGGSSNAGAGGEAGQTIPDPQEPQDGFASRVWDCCKPSCAWTSNATNPVDSCDIDGDTIDAPDTARNGCEPNGTAFTCNSFAPWSVSDTLSYGFATYNGAPCGACFQLQFTGTSSRGTPTPGLEGKQMIVQVINIGGIETNEFDLLIPGGGVGALNGCATQWGTGELGAQYGGWRTSCGDDAECIRSSCQAVFGDDAELMGGCNWYVDWLQMADLPDIRYTQVECPEALTAVSGG